MAELFLLVEWKQIYSVSVEIPMLAGIFAPNNRIGIV
jgi:hypothetical protein